MILAVPVFPASAPQKALLWHSLEGMSLLSWTMRRFSDAAMDGMKVIVYSDCQAVLDDAVSLDFDVQPMAINGSSDAPFLPRGTGAVLRHLSESLRVKWREAIMIADYRTPLLDWQTMAKAVAEFNESGPDALFSLAPLEDHPCQLDAYFQVVDTVIASVPHGDSPVLAPSPDMDWDRRKTHANRSHPPWMTLSVESGPSCQKGFLIPEKEGMALYVKSDCLRNASIARLWQVQGDGTAGPEALDVPIPPVEHLRPLSVLGYEHEVLGPVHTFGSTVPIRLVISMFLRPCTQGDADLIEPLHGTGKLWDVDQATGRRLNGHTGSAINGRQSFPDMLALHSACVIGCIRSLALEDPFLTDRFQGFSLTRSQALCVNTSLDLLKVKACLTARRIHTSKMKTPTENQTIQINNTLDHILRHNTIYKSTVNSLISHNNFFLRKIKHILKYLSEIKNLSCHSEKQRHLKFSGDVLRRFRQGLLQEASLYRQLQEYAVTDEQADHINGLGRIASLMESGITALLERLSRTDEHFQDILDTHLEEKGHIAFEAGQGLYDEGEFKKALLAWEQALQCDPENAMIHEVLASTEEAPESIEASGEPNVESMGSTLKGTMDDGRESIRAAGEKLVPVPDSDTDEKIHRLRDTYRFKEITPGPIQHVPFPRILSADGSGSVFFSAFNPNRQSPSLRRFDVHTMRHKNLRTDRQYSGLWFDPERQALYALRILLGGEWLPAIEMMDREGEILKERPISNTGSRQVLFPSRLAGDASGILYTWDVTKHQIVCFGRDSLEPTDAIRFPQIQHLTAFKCIKQKLYLIFKSLHLIAIYDLYTRNIEWISNDSIRFPIDILMDFAGKNIFMIRSRHSFNSFDEYDQHAIIKFDLDLNEIYRKWVGHSRISDAITISNQGDTYLFVADMANGLRWFHI